MGARARQRRARRQRTRRPISAQLGAALDAQSGRRLRAAAVAAQARPEHAATPRSSCPTFEVGRKAGLGEAVADTDDGIDALVGRARPTSSRSTTNGASAPASTAISSRSCARSCRATWTRASAFATWTSRTRASASPRRPTRPTARVGLEGALLAPTTVRKGLDAGERLRAAGRAGARMRRPTRARRRARADPLVAPPIYGCWHAQVERVSADAGDAAGSTTLNLDPRYRAAAGLGARVDPRRTRSNTCASRGSRSATCSRSTTRSAARQLATKASSAAYAKTVAPLPRASAPIALASPVFAQGAGQPDDAARARQREPRAARRPVARVPQAAASARRRSRGACCRPTRAWTALATHARGHQRRDASRRRRRAPPAGGATVEADQCGRHDRAAAVGSAGCCATRWWLLADRAAGRRSLFFARAGRSPHRCGDLRVAIGVCRAAVARRAAQPCRRIATELLHLRQRARRRARSPRRRRARPTPTPAPADDAARRRAHRAAGAPAVAGDSAAAADMRRALIDFHDALAVRVAPPPAEAGARSARSCTARRWRRSSRTRRSPRASRRCCASATRRSSRIATRALFTGAAGGGEHADVARGDELPGHQGRRCTCRSTDISSEYFVPNLKLIPNNTISLMKTNQPFIESYLRRPEPRVRARAAVARVSDRPAGQLLPAVLGRVELCRPRRHAMPKTLAERSQGHPAAPRVAPRRQRSARTTSATRRATQTQVVLVIRGDLLKRYPQHVHLRAAGDLGQRRRAPTGSCSPTRPASCSRRSRRTRACASRCTARRSRRTSTSSASI